MKCFHRLADLPEPVGAVFISVPPDQAVAAIRDAAAAGVRRVWLQPGAASPYVLGVCRDLGLETVADECILMFVAPHGIHKAHRWVDQMLHRLPA
jgi:predicted CoA-binding protein